VSLGKVIGTGLAICAGSSPALAYDPAIPVHFCVAEDFDYQEKFVSLLKSSHSEDYQSFVGVNGFDQKGYPTRFPSFSSYRGSLSGDEAFSLFARSFGSLDQREAKIISWKQLFSKPRGQAVFYTKISRSIWWPNIDKNQESNGKYIEKSSSWLVFFDDGCLLHAVHETPANWNAN